MALMLYFLVYLMLAFVGRSVLVYRKTGINPFTQTSADDAYGVLWAYDYEGEGISVSGETQAYIRGVSR